MKTDLRTSLGDSIRIWRKKGGFTLNQLAELAGVDTGFLTYIEHGQKTPSLETLVKIAKALGVHVSVLFQPVKDKPDPDHELIQQVRALFHGRSVEQKSELVAILKSLRNPKKIKALKQLIGK